MITCETCLSRSRGLLNDEDAGAHRWNDEMLLAFLNASLYDFFVRRSDLLVKPDGTNATDGEACFASLGGTVDFLPQKYADAISYGCAARALELDNSDTANQQNAVSFFQRAMQEAMK